jgi:hypothetical protein
MHRRLKLDPQQHPWPRFLIGRSNYSNEKGMSGGAVVGLDSQGRVVLLGVHVSNEYLSPDDEIKMRESSASNITDSSFRVGDSDDDESMANEEHEIPAGEIEALHVEAAAPVPVALQAGEPVPSAAPASASAAASAAAAMQPQPHDGSRKSSLSTQSDSSASQVSSGAAPPSSSKPHTIRSVLDRVEHLAGVQGRSVFVVAHSALAARTGWSVEELQQLAEARVQAVAGAASAAPAVHTYNLRRVSQQHVSRCREGAPSFAVTMRDGEKLYDAV